MDKKALAEKVAVSEGVTERVALNLINTVFQTITTSLASGEEVKLHGFGSFVAKDRAARQGVNPQTGEKINIAKTTVARFKPGKSLKDAVRP